MSSAYYSWFVLELVLGKDLTYSKAWGILSPWLTNFLSKTFLLVFHSLKARIALISNCSAILMVYHFIFSYITIIVKGLTQKKVHNVSEEVSEREIFFFR